MHTHRVAKNVWTTFSSVLMEAATACAWIFASNNSVRWCLFRWCSASSLARRSFATSGSRLPSAMLWLCKCRWILQKRCTRSVVAITRNVSTHVSIPFHETNGTYRRTMLPLATIKADRFTTAMAAAKKQTATTPPRCNDFSYWI